MEILFLGLYRGRGGSKQMRACLELQDLAHKLGPLRLALYLHLWDLREEVLGGLFRLARGGSKQTGACMKAPNSRTTSPHHLHRYPRLSTLQVVILLPNLANKRGPHRLALQLYPWKEVSRGLDRLAREGSKQMGACMEDIFRHQQLIVLKL
ncbi:hypothetical protein P3X46_024502 [Hevea brasiliensis]|uniref:Uncharacterized protein n=1 Tax=Hevea brasiliensis TaxID=3981 RepID=A0ABQ9L2P4_HEVBR|nr:hypothetical protein P3X46_024502 [Hevea brasiliensis]